MDIKVEKFLQKNIFPELEKGRPNWDKPHTKSVVFYIKEIIRNARELTLDDDVLIVVAYAHDWGYANLFQKGQHLGNENIEKVKELHVKISAEKIAKLLESPIFNFLQSEQKKRICHLVLIHDSLEKLKDADELVFMEADTLGQLDVNLVTPTLNEKDNEEYVNKKVKNRVSRFITTFGKRKVRELYSLRKEYYQNLKLR